MVLVLGIGRESDGQHVRRRVRRCESRLKNLPKPKPANSVRLPVRGHWSDFGFGASALSPLYKTASSSSTP